MKSQNWIKSMFIVLCGMMMATSFVACGGDDDSPNGNNGGNNGGGNSGGGSTTEEVVTGTASNITTSSATVTGTFTSSANAGSIQLGVLFSTERSAVDNKQGTLGLANTVSGNSFTVELSSLLSNTIYYYRAYMVSGNNTYYGSVGSFTTSKDELVTTGDATDITYKSATISSSFKTNVIQSFTALGIQYSDNQETLERGMGHSKTTSSVTSTNVFTISLDELNEQTTYYYRAYVKDYKTTYYGDTKSFTTATHVFNSNGHDYVDLGLPSGTMWATMNVGASKPEEIGDFYAWGETTTKTSFTTDNYQWQGLSIDELISRGVVSEEPNGSYYNGNSYVDYILTASYDVATVKWGGDWRMPTGLEISELEEYTKITKSTQNGVDGFLLTSTKNKNSIFLPATSTYSDYYMFESWGSEPNPYYNSRAASIDISSYSSSGMSHIYNPHNERYSGLTVRPVCK